MYYHYNSVFLLFSFFLKEPFFEKYKNFKIPHTRAIETLFYQAFLDNSITYKISIWISIWKIYRDEYNFKLLTSLLVTLLRISFSGHLRLLNFPLFITSIPPFPALTTIFHSPVVVYAPLKLRFVHRCQRQRGIR